MTPESLVAELCDRGVTIEAAGDELRLHAPQGAMAPDLLAAVRDSKAELLKLLEPTEVVPIPGAIESRADREWDRFLACAIPTPNGLGLYAPAESPEMASGVPGEQRRAFEDDFAHLGRGSKA